MATLERQYNVPLRREWLRVQKFRRAKRAVTALRNFLIRHMKSKNVKLGPHVNEAIWARGIRSPPHHVSVNVTKDETGLVIAELVGKPMPGSEKKETPKNKAGKEAKAAKPATETPKAAPKAEVAKPETPKAKTEAPKVAPKTPAAKK